MLSEKNCFNPKQVRVFFGEFYNYCTKKSSLLLTENIILLIIKAICFIYGKFNACITL